MQIRLPKYRSLDRVIQSLHTQLLQAPDERRAALAQRLAMLQSAQEHLHKLRLTTCELDALTLIARLRIAPSSAIVALLSAHRTTIHRALQRLYQRGVVNRFSFPIFAGLAAAGEFHYFLDSRSSLDLLASERGLSRDDLRAVLRRDITKLMADPNRAEEYVGKFLYLKHENGISRFHTMLRLACDRSAGQLELVKWLQGSLTWDRVLLPKLIFEPGGEGGGRWIESDEEQEELPFRPDAIYCIRFQDEFEGSSELTFIYEHDRDRMNSARMRDKFRAAYHYLIRQRKHQTRFGIERVRAVQVETAGELRRDHLREQVAHPAACGQANGLFWFTDSNLFTEPVTATVGKRSVTAPRFLREPEIILQPIWYTATGQTPLSLRLAT